MGRRRCCCGECETCLDCMDYEGSAIYTQWEFTLPEIFGVGDCDPYWTDCDFAGDYVMTYDGICKWHYDNSGIYCPCLFSNYLFGAAFALSCYTENQCRARLAVGWFFGSPTLGGFAQGYLWRKIFPGDPKATIIIEPEGWFNFLSPNCGSFCEGDDDAAAVNIELTRTYFTP